MYFIYTTMLIITGSIAYDCIMGFPGSFNEHILPDQIHNLNLSFIVDNYAKRRGGTAGNASYALHLLGVPNILYSYAGKDFREYTDELQKLGVILQGVHIDKDAYTATGFALTDQSDNQIWAYYYGAAEKNETLSLKDVAHAGDLVLVGPQGAKGSMHFIDEAIAMNLQYMFDPGFILTQVSDADLKRGIDTCAYLIGNEYEFELIKSRIQNWKKVFEGKVIITTLAEEGALIQKDSEIYKIPVVKTTVATTVGAGDAWRGGFLAGITHGYDLQTCGQMGSVAGAYAVESAGTQDYFYTKEDFVERYKKNFNSSITL